MIITPVIPENLLPGQTIKATAWEISKQPVFDIGNYILGRMPFNILNKTSVSMDIDTTKLLSPYVYVRVQYQFMDDSISDFTQPFLFEIEEFIGVTNTSIIKIPKISVNLDYQVVDETEVTYDYRTLLIGKDVTIGRLEHDSYENIVIYNNATLTIIDE